MWRGWRCGARRPWPTRRLGRAEGGGRIVVLGEAAKEADAGAPLTSAAAARAGGGKGIGGTGGRSSRRRLGSQTLPRGGKRGAAGDGGSRMARPCRLEPRIDIPARSRGRGLGRPWMETGGGGGAFARGTRSTLRPPPPSLRSGPGRRRGAGGGDGRRGGDGSAGERGAGGPAAANKQSADSKKCYGNVRSIVSFIIYEV